MPYYNASEYVEEAVNSLIQQTYCLWDLIIVDDSSSDKHRFVLDKIADLDSRITIVRKSVNEGAAVSRNLAIKEASGQYIAFLDSDDIWLPHKLETQVAFMQQRNVPFTYSAYDRISEDGSPLGRVGVPDKVNYKQLLKTCVIGCLTAMYDTDHFGKVYMPLIRKRQDFGLWLRLLKQTDYAYGIQEPLAEYRVRTDSISANKASAASYTWKLYREVEQLSRLRSCYYFSHYAVRGVLRQRFPQLARRLGVLQ